MTDRYAVESLLRPPVEFFSAVVSLFAGVLIAVAPYTVLAPPTIAYAVSGLCFVLALHRAYQGWQVIRYQQHLHQVPRYQLTEAQIPVSRSHVFLGLGFLWEQRHTQRLHDIRTSEGLRYIEPAQLVGWVARKRIEWQEQRILHELTRLLSLPVPGNPFRPRPAVGGLPYLHGLGVRDEQAVYFSLQARRQHLIVKGASGVGKTRVAQMLITQDIRRQGNTVIILDPKGDAELLLTAFEESRAADRPLYTFHLGFPQYSCRYNAISSFTRITEIPSRIASNLSGEGDAAAFREFSWMFINIVSMSLLALEQVPTYKLIRKYIRHIDPLFMDYGLAVLKQHCSQDWQQKLEQQQQKITDKYLQRSPFRDRQKKAVALLEVLQSLDLDDPVLMGLMYAFRFERSYYDKITTAVAPFLDKLLAGEIGDIIAPNYADTKDTRPILDWAQAIRQQAVVYVGLDALTDAEVSSAIGASMFADLTSLAGRKIKFGTYQGLPDIGEPDKENDVIIHGDEFSDLLGRGPHMKTLLNKSRAAKFSLNLYTQSWYDPEAELGEAKAGQLAGNINTTLILRVQDKKTAQMFCDKLPETFVHSLTAVSGIKDSPSSAKAIEFESSNEDRLSKESVPMLTASDITGLPIGQGYCLLNGSELWKIRFPEPTPRQVHDLPEAIQVMTDHMKTRYRSQDNVWYEFDSSIDLLSVQWDQQSDA